MFNIKYNYIEYTQQALSVSETQALQMEVELEDLKNNMLIIKERKTTRKVLGSRKTEGRTRNKENNRKTLKHCNRYKKKKSSMGTYTNYQRQD